MRKKSNVSTKEPLTLQDMALRLLLFPSNHGFCKALNVRYPDDGRLTQ